MKFSGRLHTGPEPAIADKAQSNPANWLRADLSLVGGRVELKAGDEFLGSWSTSQVKAQRLEGDRFELSLGGDRAVFAADDALGFSYDALPQLSKKPLPPAAIGGIRGLLLGGKRASAAEAPVEVALDTHRDGTKASAESLEAVVETPMVPAAGSAPVARRLRDLIDAARSAGASEPSVKTIVVDDLASIPITLVSPRDETISIASPMSDELMLEELMLNEPEFKEPLFEEPGPDLDGSDPAPPIIFLGVEHPVLAELTPPSALETIASLEPVEFDARPWSREAEQDPQPIDLIPLFAKSGLSAPSNGSGNLQPVVAALEGIADQVRDGSMTTAQVDAITRLLDAVIELINANKD